MEFIILGALFAIGKLIVLIKLFSLKKLLWFEKYIDLFFTLILPILFFGTFSGALLAIFSGLWLSLLLRCCALFVKPEPPDLWPWKPIRRNNRAGASRAGS